MGSLTFRFSGVCTHFLNGIVPGIPYRVVLCDLTKFLVGALQIEGMSQEPALYYTTPHFAQFDIKALGTAQCGDSLDEVDQAMDLSGLLTIPNLIASGDILGGGIRLQVINATDTGIVGSLNGIPSLRDFYPNYAPASDVVLNGRASCYIDFFGGCLWVAGQETPELPRFACVRVATDGPPKLMVTPLSPSASTPAWQPIVLPPKTAPGDNFTMIVKNLESDTDVGRDSDFDLGIYDYLLHYVTAQGGIPQALTQPTPGLKGFNPLPSATAKDIGSSFIMMGNALSGNFPPTVAPTTASALAAGRRRLIRPNSVTPACADSQYP